MNRRLMPLGLKDRIDAMTREELATILMRAPSGSEWFVGEAGHYFMDRLVSLGGLDRDERARMSREARLAEAERIDWKNERRPITDPHMLSAASPVLMSVIGAVLLFFEGGPWTHDQQKRWKILTGSDHVTNRALCDWLRKIRDENSG
jgi:hypothetical protein